MLAATDGGICPRFVWRHLLFLGISDKIWISYIILNIYYSYIILNIFGIYVSTCVVPRTLSSYGDRTFAAAGPRLWNFLPVQLRNPDITIQTTAEGTHFFREA